jgi:competence protein ComEC
MMVILHLRRPVLKKWDGVMFEVLNPDNNTRFQGNNASCMLRISNGKYSVLLTGDIEKETER